ncbi:toll-like receptor 13 [Lates japonicus]
MFPSLDFLAQANLMALSSLKLTENQLSIISETVLQSLPALTYLDLNDNPLTCACSNAGLNQWVLTNNQTQVVDGYQYTCAFPVSQQGNRLLDFDIHSCWVDANFLCFISSTSLVVLTLLTSFIYHFLRWHLAYAYYLFLAFLYDKKRRKKGTPDHYDAFVSYNVRDEAWVYRELLPVLEGQQGWRLCLHHRDFEPGKPIIENITEAIYGSRKTICVISQNYLQSEWCSREIQMASFRLFDEHKDVLILLFLEDIPAQQLSPYYRMRSLVKKRTYLSWPKAGQHTGVFWMNINRALETAESPTEHTHLLTGHPRGL